MNISRTPRVKKLITILLVNTFIISSTTTSYGQSVQITSSYFPEVKLYSDLNQLQIPSELGTVQKTNLGKTAFSIIHIQDAHGQIDAQKKYCRNH